MGVAKLTEQNTLVPDSKYALLERERRYLLQDLPEQLSRADPHLQITDNYITGTRLRLRKVRDPLTNKWTVKFTQKFGSTAMKILIVLASHPLPWRMSRTRSCLPADGCVI